MEDGDVLYAAKNLMKLKFYFHNQLGTKSSTNGSIFIIFKIIMGCYCWIVRFKKYIQNKNLDYANYLLAVCYYEQIVDEKIYNHYESEESFNFTKNYPNTEYALMLSSRLT